MNDDWDGLRELVDSAVPLVREKRQRRRKARPGAANVTLPAAVAPALAPAPARIVRVEMTRAEWEVIRARRRLGWVVIAAVWVVLILWVMVK
jgi:hypothetical protein